MSAGSAMRLRRATPADATAVAALLAASYEANPKADPQVLRWQYWDNPFGQARSWVAEVGGEVVSHWAAIAVPLRVGGRAVTAVKGVDIATHPAHRRRGLFAAVARALLQDCAAAGVDVLLSHPNPGSAPAVEAAGARLVGNAGAWVRALDPAFVARRAHLPLPLARLGTRLAFPPGSQVDGAGPAGAPPDDLDDLWQAVAADQPTGVTRDAAWWRWRYAGRPGGSYGYVTARRDGRLTGASAYVVQERFGGHFALVCELLASSRAAARGLVLALGAQARGRGAHGLAAVALPSTHQARLLAGAGLRRLPRRLEPRPLRVMVAVPGGDAARLATRGWALSWGDLDHL